MAQGRRDWGRGLLDLWGEGGFGSGLMSLREEGLSPWIPETFGEKRARGLDSWISGEDSGLW